MKTTLLILLFIPLLSFGQLSNKEKKKIDKYAVKMCECVNDLMAGLHPKTIEFTILMAEKGKEEARKDLQSILAEMSPEELQEFIASIKTMTDPTFLEKIEACDGSAKIGKKLKTQLDSAKGPAHTYLMDYLSKEEKCQLMKSLYEIGTEASE